MSKMGISTIHSYHGAQIFEAVGIKQDLIDKYFCNTPSRIEGLGIAEIAKENALRHQEAYSTGDKLERGDFYQYHKGGQPHIIDPETGPAPRRKPSRPATTQRIKNTPTMSTVRPFSACATSWTLNILPAAASLSKKSNLSIPSSSASARVP
mgnify:CR=1 FL=1